MTPTQGSSATRQEWATEIGWGLDEFVAMAERLSGPEDVVLLRSSSVESNDGPQSDRSNTSNAVAQRHDRPGRGRCVRSTVARCAHERGPRPAGPVGALNESRLTLHSSVRCFYDRASKGQVVGAVGFEADHAACALGRAPLLHAA
jgi:hypothetical protein